MPVLSPLEPVFERSASQEFRDTESDAAHSAEANALVSGKAGADDMATEDPDAKEKARELSGWEITMLWAGCAPKSRNMPRHHQIVTKSRRVGASLHGIASYR